MSVERFIADRISKPGENKSNISKPIVKIGITGISLGICVMLLTVSIVLGFKREITGRITGLTTHISINNISQNASNEPEPLTISADTLALISKLPFVRHIQATAFKNGLLKTDHENEGVLLKGVDKNYDFSFLGKHLVEGKLPDFSGESASNDILISEALSKRMSLKLGEKMLIYFIAQREVYDSLSQDVITKSEQRSRVLKICGIFKTDFADFDNKLSIVDIRQIRRINYWDERVAGTYEVQVRDFDHVNEDTEALMDILGYSYNISPVTETYSNIFVWLDKLDINGEIIVALMIIVATINMITALLILILERSNMIGLVKALGMSNARVRKIFLFVSLRLVGRGLLWGNVAGIGLCLIQYYFKIAKLNSETYYVDHVAIHINWWLFALLNAGTVAVCTLMLFFPTLLITKMTPVKTLKFD